MVIFINTNYFSIFLIIFLVRKKGVATEALKQRMVCLYFFRASMPLWQLARTGKKSRPEESGRDVFKHEKNLQSLFFPVFRKKADE